jgi:hypothetical protein
MLTECSLNVHPQGSVKAVGTLHTLNNRAFFRQKEVKEDEARKRKLYGVPDKGQLVSLKWVRTTARSLKCDECSLKCDECSLKCEECSLKCNKCSLNEDAVP